jgi:hypothetical protein
MWAARAAMCRAAYSQTVKQLVKALREAIEAEAGGAKELEVKHSCITGYAAACEHAGKCRQGGVDRQDA